MVNFSQYTPKLAKDELLNPNGQWLNKVKYHKKCYLPLFNTIY